MKADDQTILSLHTRVITHNPRISVTHDDSLRTWQLRIRQLKESDRGCYMCQINTGEMKKLLGCIDVQGLFHYSIIVVLFAVILLKYKWEAISKPIVHNSVSIIVINKFYLSPFRH